MHLQGFKTLCSLGARHQSQIKTRNASTISKSLAKERRNELFQKEHERQRKAVGRIEKIEVKYYSPIEEVTLMMNKNLSTPHDCARHLSDGVTNASAVAMLNDKLWDMHRPIPESCSLRLLNMKMPETIAVNAAFWRSCSFILGAVIDNSFKDDINVHLHSFTSPNLKSGSFVHDAYIDMPEWKPTDAEFRALSAAFVKLTQQRLPLERLQVSEEIAMEMFEDNPFKSKQIPDIARHSENLVTLYRMGDHIDISKGPMIGNTGIIGRITVAAIHKINSEDGELYRFQGVAIPSGILLNHFAYSILEARARKLNSTSWMPARLTDDLDENIAVVAKN